MPGGHPYKMGRTPSHFPFAFPDSRCGKVTRITAAEWARTPQAEDDTLETDTKPRPVRALGPGGNSK